MAVGTVTHINARNGMFIVAIEAGDYAAFQNLSSTEIAVGDRISGDLDALGSEDLLHLGEGEMFEASGESGPCGLQACLRVAFGG
ncbi:hypothetical protein DFQ15_102212 [Xylophilus ampelinus]|uniref:Uncharacterized protein n=1 Tax=Xylophilus ampelinus TaxID=54067 RepID=A0A318SQ87_9BURK|nr:hypothetical protein DFQ15_102212 [Xylophilus ampelinus]